MHTGATLAATLVALLTFASAALVLAGLEPIRAAKSLEAAVRAQEEGTPQGYDDTPHLPGGTWRVHDKSRPVPAVVAPGASDAAPPSDAIVLFDGRDTSAWHQGGEPIAWTVEDGALVVSGGGSIETHEAFGDCQLHLEWRSPAEVVGESQGRGNSGVFFMGRYEVQILDSFANRSYADGQAAALYGQHPPLVNACREPGAWQSYDIVFRAPRFEQGECVQPARVTALHNGVLVHDAVELFGATRHREVATYAEHEPELPLALQDHGNPVAFRNVWIRRL